MMRKPYRSLVYRANRRGLPNLPLGVRSSGRYFITREWREKITQKWFCQLFWTVEGRGAFALGDQKFEVGPGEIFIYRPGDTHDLQVVSDYWDYCWLTFDHADIRNWLDNFGLERPAYAPGNCPTALFAQLKKALLECTPQGERAAAHVAHAILLAASSHLSAPQAHSLPARARVLLDRNFAKPAWGISDVIAALEVHRTTLLRTFEKHYGLTPSRYLQNRRLQCALSLLRENTLQIQEIAWRSGFADPNYLARAVHQATGMSPREFRKQ